VSPPGDGETLLQIVTRVLAADTGPAYPRNPVLLRLLAEGTFEHGGQTYRTAHRMEPDVCELMGRLVLDLSIDRVLEVGTLFGFSTLYLAEALAATGGRLTTVDIRPEEDLWDRHSPAGGKPIRNVHEVAERLVAESGFDAFVEFRVGHSNDVLPEMVRAGQRFGLAVVDGAHDFPTVLLDVLSVDWMLDPGGFLVLDDVGSDLARRGRSEGGPNRLLESLFAAGRYEILPLTRHAAVCRKRAA
jgi:predicted O-methyltransferase YrrM